MSEVFFPLMMSNWSSFFKPALSAGESFLTPERENIGFKTNLYCKLLLKA